jgi:hypothetical protein
MNETWAEKEQNISALIAVANARPVPTYAAVCWARIESNYDTSAYNDSSGAMGMFQIKPSTFLQPGFGVTPGATLGDLADATKSTEFACDYLQGLYNDVNVGNNSWALAFLHYNVGPGADPNTASQAYKALAVLVSTLEGEEYPLSEPFMGA